MNLKTETTSGGTQSILPCHKNGVEYTERKQILRLEYFHVM
jgi:hypothetical protein